MKKYAVVVDISPSEQLSDDDNEFKSMAFLFGLRSPTSFDEVGLNYPNSEQRLKLRKWSGARPKYKSQFVDHAQVLANSAAVIFGVNLASNVVIRDVGKRYWELLMGEIPDSTKYSRKGRPLVTMGGYKVDGKTVPPWNILVDDLIVLGWYAEALVSCLKSLVEINEERVELDVLIDHLPNEQGGDEFYKATLLKQICKKGSDGLLTIAGVPEQSDSMQRELLVDCLAGLYREISLDSSSPYIHAKSLYRFSRYTV